MRIADSHEFIELYRGDKDLRIGIEMLKQRRDLEFISLAPDKMSPTDQSRFGVTRMADGPLPEVPDRFGLRLLPSISVSFAKKESGGIMSLMPTYGRHLAAERPDVIFENPFSWLTPRSYQTYSVSRRLRVPVVYYDPGDDIPISRRQRVLAVFERRVIKSASRIITYNEAGKLRFMTKYGYPAARIHVIPKPVDVAAFDQVGEVDDIRAKLGAGSRETLLIGYVGRLARYKGSAVLAEVAGAAARDTRLRDARFVFIGGALASTETEDEYALPNATVTGMVSRDDVPGYLKACDVMVFPDITRPGGFPTAVAEAMAAGTTIILGSGTNEDSPYVPLRHGVDSLLVEPSCAEAITAALRRVMEDRIGAQRLGIAAHVYAREYMDYPVVARQYLRIAEQAIEEMRLLRESGV